INQQVWAIDDQGNAKQIEEFLPVSTINQEPLPLEPQRISIADCDLLMPFEGGVEVVMKELCLARSGDKGNSANLGILARNQRIYAYLKMNLGAEIIQKWLGDLCKGEITRYELDGLIALNFILEEALDGGGTSSARLDPQGKMLASAFLAQRVYVPIEIRESVYRSGQV